MRRSGRGRAGAGSPRGRTWSLDGLGAVDLAPSRAGDPRRVQRGRHGGEVTFQARGELRESLTGRVVEQLAQVFLALAAQERIAPSRDRLGVREPGRLREQPGNEASFDSGRGGRRGSWVIDDGKALGREQDLNDGQARRNQGQGALGRGRLSKGGYGPFMCSRRPGTTTEQHGSGRRRNGGTGRAGEP